MATLLKVTCPKCSYTWETTYEDLQKYRVIYKGLPSSTGRREEYIVPCPNPTHGEAVVITIQVEE